MVTDSATGTRIDEIASQIYRISVPAPGGLPGGFSFNHFLIAGDEPVLFHAGYRRMFPLVSAAIAKIVPPSRIRHIGYSHYEPDESGAVPELLATAKDARVFSSDIGTLVSGGDLWDRPTKGLADGEEFTAGDRKLVWLSTPHVPHGWDCGILFDKSSGTLFCGDLFTQGGTDNPPVTEQEILTRSEQFRKPMDYFAHAAGTTGILSKLAALNPKLLACQHGSAYSGDGAALIRELAKTLELERRADPVPA